MKKGTGILVVFVVALFVGGCGEQKPSDTSAATPDSKASAAATTPARAAESTGVPECDAYLAALDKLMSCAKVPQAARDAQAQSAKQMRSSWASWSAMPEDARKMAQAAAKTSCSSALSTVKQVASANGCPVD